MTVSPGAPPSPIVDAAVNDTLTCLPSNECLVKFRISVSAWMAPARDRWNGPNTGEFVKPGPFLAKMLSGDRLDARVHRDESRERS